MGLIVPPRLYSKVPLSPRGSFKLHNGAYATSGGSGQTIRILHNLPAGAVWVRLVYFNDVNATQSIGGAAISPSSQPGNGYQPYNAAGAADDTQWIPVTFNNAGADIDPISQAGGSTVTATIPANTGRAGQPVEFYSDWMPIIPQPRIDGGKGSLLLVGTYSTGTQRYSSGAPAPDAATGIAWNSHWSGTNGTVSPFGFTANSFGFGTGPCGVQFITEGQCATVVDAGDSILLSLATTGSCSGPVMRACAALSTPARPVSSFNLGYSGQVSQDFIANGLWALNTLKPQVMVIQGWSQNDNDASNTLAVAQLCVQRALSLADKCLKLGCWPILTTGAPVGVSNPAEEPNRVAANAMIRAAAASGFDVLDLDAIWGTGASPNAYQTGYNSGDNKHPTDAACAAAAIFLGPMIARAIGLQ